MQGYVPIYLLFGAKMPLNVETLMELAFVGEGWSPEGVVPPHSYGILNHVNVLPI